MQSTRRWLQQNKTTRELRASVFVCIIQTKFISNSLYSGFLNVCYKMVKEWKSQMCRTEGCYTIYSHMLSYCGIHFLSLPGRGFHQCKKTLHVYRVLSLAELPTHSRPPPPPHLHPDPTTTPPLTPPATPPGTPTPPHPEPHPHCTRTPTLPHPHQKMDRKRALMAYYVAICVAVKLSAHPHSPNEPSGKLDKPRQRCLTDLWPTFTIDP